MTMTTWGWSLPFAIATSTGTSRWFTLTRTGLISTIGTCIPEPSPNIIKG